MAWRAASGADSTTSRPTSGPQSSPTISLSLRASSRPDSLLPPSCPTLADRRIDHPFQPLRSSGGDKASESRVGRTDIWLGRKRRFVEWSRPSEPTSRKRDLGVAARTMTECEVDRVLGRTASCKRFRDSNILSTKPLGFVDYFGETTGQASRTRLTRAPASPVLRILDSCLALAFSLPRHNGDASTSAGSLRDRAVGEGVDRCPKVPAASSRPSSWRSWRPGRSGSSSRRSTASCPCAYGRSAPNPRPSASRSRSLAPSASAIAR
jgi:hypothetical protein